jgi:carbonic anhydrase
MSLVETLRKNAAYIKVKSVAKEQRKDVQPRCLVITDSSPELTGVIAPALGLRPGQASIIRLAGAWGARDGQELIRSVVLAVYLHKCEEIFVVGHDDCIYCPVDRSKLRNNMSAAGLLDKLPDGGEGLLGKIRGPGSPEIAVTDTVNLLRKSLVPKGIPVHGCMLDSRSGALRVVDEDNTFIVVDQDQSDVIVGTPLIEEIPLPELPDIQLPEIPELDLDALTAAPVTPEEPAEPKPFEYGSNAGSIGPVTFDEMQAMPESQAFQSESASSIQTARRNVGMGIEVPKIRFEVPKGPEVQGIGISQIEMPPPLPADFSDLEAKQDVPAKQRVRAQKKLSAQEDVTARKDITAQRRIRAQQPQQKKTKRPTPARSKPETPAVTPIVRKAQKPLGEREITFASDRPAKQESEIRVDVHGGFVSHRGSEFPIDPQLQQALIKIQQFLAQELTRQARNGIINQVRRGLSSGQSVGELLKFMIGPVLKLGKKRYAVINELLKIKEELPRQAPAISAAILEEILSNR